MVGRETTIVPIDLFIQLEGSLEACFPLRRYSAVIPRDHVEMVGWIAAVSLLGHDTGDGAEVYQGIGLIIKEPSDTAPHVPAESPDPTDILHVEVSSALCSQSQRYP